MPSFDRLLLLAALAAGGAWSLMGSKVHAQRPVEELGPVPPPPGANLPPVPPAPGARRGPSQGRNAAGPHPVTPDPGARTPPPPREGPPREGPPPDLRPPVLLAETAGWIFEDAEPIPDDPEERVEREAEAQLYRRIQEDQLRHVGGDDYYHQLSQQARRSLRVDPREVTQERRRGMSVLQRAVDELGRYASGPSAPGTVPGTAMPETQRQFDNAERANLERMEQENLNNAPVRWYQVEIRIHQAPDGDLLAIWITRSSRNRVVDEAVLDAFRRGSARVPAPPREIVGNRRVIGSEWLVEVGDVATYLNQAGCVDDPVNGGYQCAAGGRGIVRTRMRLIRVIDATHPTWGERLREQRREEEARREREARERATQPAPSGGASRPATSPQP